ncbi:zinc ABC transporter substrate-binding protein, partial [candidate division WOR-3 bacterium]|nr:zinc ABC transporter substrate-binding protein [candidate division WOR-3 bacterium]
NDSINRDLYEKNYLSMKKNINNADSIIKFDIEKHGTFSVIAFHNSFDYFLEHYGIELAGLIEKIPGREPSPKDLLELKRIIEKTGISVLFTEPELSDKGAQVLGKELNLSLYTIDPLGNTFDINSIDELYTKNYNVLIRARK